MNNLSLFLFTNAQQVIKNQKLRHLENEKQTMKEENTIDPNLREEVFNILSQRGYSPEVHNERLIAFTYKQSNFHLYIAPDGHCYFGIIYIDSHINSINKGLLYSVAYETMRTGSFTKFYFKGDRIVYHISFICTSLEEFPVKYMKDYLDCILDTATDFMMRIEQLLAAKELNDADLDSITDYPALFRYGNEQESL